jgi:hypothetical protein
MKKIFRILPPLQWCSLLFAAFAAILQVLAMFFCYEKEINHFSQGSILPTLALVCFGLSLVTGIIAALIPPKAELAQTVFSNKRKFPLPAFGFALLTDILLFCLISTASSRACTNLSLLSANLIALSSVGLLMPDPCGMPSLSDTDRTASISSVSSSSSESNLWIRFTAYSYCLKYSFAVIVLLCGCHPMPPKLSQTLYFLYFSIT